MKSGILVILIFSLHNFYAIGEFNIRESKPVIFIQRNHFLFYFLYTFLLKKKISAEVFTPRMHNYDNSGESSMETYININGTKVSLEDIMVYAPNGRSAKLGIFPPEKHSSEMNDAGSAATETMSPSSDGYNVNNVDNESIVNTVSIESNVNTVNDESLISRTVNDESSDELNKSVVISSRETTSDTEINEHRWSEEEGTIVLDDNKDTAIISSMETLRATKTDSDKTHDTNSNEFFDLNEEPGTNHYFSNLFNKAGSKSFDENDDYDKDALSCVECDTRIDGSRCYHVNNVDYVDTCHSKIGQCYTAILSGDVVRGCVGDDVFPNTESTTSTASTASRSITIKLCNNDHLCNRENIEDTCIICSGKHRKCETPDLYMESACSFDKPSGCYLKKSGLFQRGCLKDLPEKERLECQEGSRACQSCSTQNCNQKADFDQKCYYCNGTEDANCHTENVNHIEITCINYASVCVVGIDSKGYTHRQCSLNGEIDAARFSKGYKLCYDDHCNSKIYPEDRPKCFKCNGEPSCKHPSVDMVGEYCRRFPDECFIYQPDADSKGKCQQINSVIVSRM